MTDPLKSNFWRTIFAIACVVVLAAIFYAEENYRGVRAWQKCEREANARGESLKWSDFIPAPVLDEKNFYAAPMIREWFVRDTNGLTSTPFYKSLLNPDTQTNVITEITASNYLTWCGGFETQFNLMRDALKRPAARMDGDYSRPFGQPVPNFVNYRVVCQVLAHRAKCHLLLGESANALTDLTLLNDLRQTLSPSNQPTTLVAAMINVAIAGLAADAIACGIESHSWREPELAALQKQCAEIDLVPAAVNSLQAERAGTCHLLATLRTEELTRRIGGSVSISDFGWSLMPSGWYYQNMALIATLEGANVECIDVTNRTVSPYKVQAAKHRIEVAFRRTTPWNIIAAICVPNFSKASEPLARNQTWVDQAQIACALERYRLANGKYPGTLAALVPKFMEKIPHDIVGGKPMNYFCKDGENFRLYSIGWNETDDGGIVAQTSDGKEDREHGDWVWHYPTQ